jgi:hypothetical protein
MVELSIQVMGSTHLPCTVRSDKPLKVRFSATVAEGPEVEVELT